MMLQKLCDLGAVCNACGNFVRQPKKAGYTNLISHLNLKHPGYAGVVESCIRDKRQVSMRMFIDRHAQATYQWMNLVVRKNFTFGDVGDDTVRSAIKYDSMCSKTLKARMKAAVTVIEPTIVAELIKSSLYAEGCTVLRSVVIPRRREYDR
ncbi:uncharacterized protein KRP23_2712 [Phytophthora ramorum]|uniref:uncharacterized protein n=1 Tax=Phytophthora ramorum TaxID=164328 RepID=UPI0030B3C09B|nr:hypothetical protein KRP23_2712 [Phytophthora ramorum]